MTLEDEKKKVEELIDSLKDAKNSEPLQKSIIARQQSLLRELRRLYTYRISIASKT